MGPRPDRRDAETGVGLDLRHVGEPHLVGRGDVEQGGHQLNLRAAIPVVYDQGFYDLRHHTESTYNWEEKNWSVPINLSVTQLLKVGQQRFTLQGGVRYWADSPDRGPHGWGARVALNFLFPK
jgi:hypothetical protein